MIFVVNRGALIVAAFLPAALGSAPTYPA